MEWIKKFTDSGEFLLCEKGVISFTITEKSPKQYIVSIGVRASRVFRGLCYHKEFKSLARAKSYCVRKCTEIKKSTKE